MHLFTYITILATLAPWESATCSNETTHHYNPAFVQMNRRPLFRFTANEFVALIEDFYYEREHEEEPILVMTDVNAYDFEEAAFELPTLELPDEFKVPPPISLQQLKRREGCARNCRCLVAGARGSYSITIPHQYCSKGCAAPHLKRVFSGVKNINCKYLNKNLRCEKNCQDNSKFRIYNQTLIEEERVTVKEEPVKQPRKTFSQWAQGRVGLPWRRRRRSGEFCLTLIFYTTCEGTQVTQIKRALNRVIDSVESVMKVTNTNGKAIMALYKMSSGTRTMISTMQRQMSHFTTMVQVNIINLRMQVAGSQLLAGRFPISLFAKTEQLLRMNEHLQTSGGYRDISKSRVLKYGKFHGRLYIISSLSKREPDAVKYRVVPLLHQSKFCSKMTTHIDHLVLTPSSVKVVKDHHVMLSSNALGNCFLRVGRGIRAVDCHEDFIETKVSDSCPRSQYLAPGLHWNPRTRQMHYDQHLLFKAKTRLTDIEHPQFYIPPPPTFSYANYIAEYRRRVRNALNKVKEAKDAVDDIAETNLIPLYVAIGCLAALVVIICCCYNRQHVKIPSLHVVKAETGQSHYDTAPPTQNAEYQEIPARVGRV